MPPDLWRVGTKTDHLNPCGREQNFYDSAELWKIGICQHRPWQHYYLPIHVGLLVCATMLLSLWLRTAQYHSCQHRLMHVPSTVLLLHNCQPCGAEAPSLAQLSACRSQSPVGKGRESNAAGLTSPTLSCLSGPRVMCGVFAPSSHDGDSLGFSLFNQSSVYQHMHPNSCNCELTSPIVFRAIDFFKGQKEPVWPSRARLIPCLTQAGEPHSVSNLPVNRPSLRTIHTLCLKF